jgi:predicted MFS family arabinose efflux permease
MLTGCLAGSACGLIHEFDALWGTAAGVPVFFIGVWMAGRFGLEALGGQAAAFLNRHLGPQRTGRLRLYVITAGVFMATAGVLPVIFGLPFYFSFYFMMAAGAVLVEQRLQEAIEHAGRATVLSINSMITTLAAMGISFLMGGLADTWGLPAILVLTGVLCALSAIALRSPSGKTAETQRSSEDT